MGPREQLDALANNLWWSWDESATALWRRLDADDWAAVGHDPVLLLERVYDEDLAPHADAIAEVHERFRAYQDGSGWAAEEAADLRSAAYLSMEFGLHESVPLYSGGLGVLAGDHLRSASDLGVPLVGIGLLWREGYFRQAIVDGRQEARYTPLDTDHSLLQRVQGADGPLFIDVPIGEDHCRVAIWRLDVGRVPLYLLDADVEGNPEALRGLTRRLYGGDHTDRIRQETLLGLGGMRLLHALGLEPQVIHLNEGHCAFAPLQAAADHMQAHDSSWEEACAAIRERFVFTTHTPVPAGHDRFSWPDVDGCLGAWRRSLGLPDGAFMDLGRVDPSDLGEPLCMTVVALRLSTAANGVSKLHGEVSRHMWHGLWPDAPVDEVPIGHITNGVHSTFWVSDPARALFDAHLPGWRERPWDEGLWADAARIPAAALRAMRDQNRQALIELVSDRTGVEMNPEALTIGFARRFAPYKRGDLVFRQPDRLAEWLDQGAQLIFAGKAHPRDKRGQEIVAKVLAFSRDPRFHGRVVLIPDYDIEVGRAITAGADVWLNNPRRPHEASGTSGQKVVYNGGLNLSVLDGWWVEGFDGSNGWGIGDGREWTDVVAGDNSDTESLYALLEDEVWPCWQDADAWVARVRRSLQTCAPAFNSHRMVRDYVRDLYLPRARRG